MTCTNPHSGFAPRKPGKIMQNSEISLLTPASVLAIALFNICYLFLIPSQQWFKWALHGIVLTIKSCSSNCKIGNSLSLSKSFQQSDEKFQNLNHALEYHGVPIDIYTCSRNRYRARTIPPQNLLSHDWGCLKSHEALYVVPPGLIKSTRIRGWNMMKCQLL